MRFLKFSDGNERTYDSCLPNYADFFKGDSSIRVSVANVVNFLSTSNHEIVSFTGKTGQIFESGSFFPNQFPFRDDPARQLTVRGSIRSGSFTAYASDEPEVLGYSEVNASAVDYAYRVNWHVQYIYRENPVDPAFANDVIHRVSEDGSGYPSIYADPTFGPFRYGVSNNRPEFSSAKWRTDRYGYFRDMLEPRSFTATFDGVKPIKVRFLSGSTIVDPMLTYSQNLSVFATSSMPYFDDGTARNRPDNPDETLVEVVA